MLYALLLWLIKTELFTDGYQLLLIKMELKKNIIFEVQDDKTWDWLLILQVSPNQVYYGM